MFAAPDHKNQRSWYLFNYQNPLTADILGIDYQPLANFITPNTDLYLLTLLAKAEARGLDLVFVNKEKFLNASYESIEVNYLTGEPPPWEGACHTEINLSFVLHEGHSFIYRGTAEGMGLDFNMNTQNFIGEIANDFSDTSLDWMDCEIRTVSELAEYLNGGLRPTKNNQSSIRAGKLNLQLGSSDNLPFANDSFDKVFCINVIYFWDQPEKHLSEVHRVLKPNGEFFAAIRSKESFSHLPAADYGFTLYNEEEWKTVLGQNNFTFADVTTKKEDKSKATIDDNLIPNEILCLMAKK